MLITDPNSRVACELRRPARCGRRARYPVRRRLASGGGPALTLLYVVEPLRLRYLSRDFEPPPRARRDLGSWDDLPQGI